MKVEKQTENMRYFKDVEIGDCICYEGEYFLVIAPIIDECDDLINAITLDGYVECFPQDREVEVVNAKVVIE